jgi:dipeptidase E
VGRHDSLPRVSDTHIVAMGGHALEEDWSRALEDFALELTGKARPRLLLLSQGTAERDEYRERFREVFDGRAEVSELSLFWRDETDPRDAILGQDAIFVSGGNTANLLAIWRVHDVDAALREAWRRGIVLMGSSAGMICWFQCSVTDSFGPLAPLHDGLGLLPGSACPHYDGEVERRPTYTRLVQQEGFPAGYAADDAVALHFAGTELAEAVGARPGSSAYWVGPDAEVALPTRVLLWSA